jgi:membrane protein insertase Oxa1/YidC/SpoIIIJ
MQDGSITPSQPDPMQRIRRNSRLMAWACVVIVIALPVALATYWSTVSSAELAVQGSLPSLAIQQPLLAWQRWAAGATMALPLALMLAGVWQARRCFMHFAQGLVFSAQVARYLRNAAGFMAMAGIAAVVCGAATSAILTWTNAPGTRQLSIAFSSNHIFTLFFAALVWMMADIIAKGRALVEENESFV